MKQEKYSKILAAIIIFALSIPVLEASAVFDETGIGLQITGITCGNGTCEPGLGENETSCPADCGCNNNGICESARGENSASCPLDCPVAPPVPPLLESGGALFLPDTTPPAIYNLSVSEITLNSAKITWETNEYALCQLFLGRIEEYESAIFVETALYEEHSTQLINLLPDTAYHFKISCRDVAKNESETTDQKITTLTPPDITPPANVLNFEAIAGDGQIKLNWKNPSDLDFKAVKIMRSTDFYPSDPWTGIPVYNDKGESFIDTGLTNGVRYYYTAFAYDKTGNYSSGAIATNVPQKPGAITPIIPPPEVVPPAVPPPPEIEKITFNDFDFIQEREKISPVEGKIKIKPEKPLTIAIAYEKVPEVLKTIMVTLEKEKKTFSFLLRINKEKTRYEAVISPPEPGIYPLTLTILDYKNQTLKQIKGLLVVEGEKAPLSKIPWYKKYRSCLILLAILILIIIYFIRRKLKSKKQDASGSRKDNSVWPGSY